MKELTTEQLNQAYRLAWIRMYDLVLKMYYGKLHSKDLPYDQLSKANHNGYIEAACECLNIIDEAECFGLNVVVKEN